MLDGVAGDVVLSEGSHLVRLLRSGRWATAVREAVGQNRFWGGGYPAWRELYRSGRSALAPNAVRRVYHRWLRPRRTQRRLQRALRESWIDPGFAERIGLAERLQSTDRYRSIELLPHYGAERARAIVHPNLVVGRERYDRVAAALAVEPRDPFLDRRVVELCVALPGDQKLAGGWPKAVLRHALAGRLPDSVRWRLGKEHLGWTFTSSLMRFRMNGWRLASRLAGTPYCRTSTRPGRGRPEARFSCWPVRRCRQSVGSRPLGRLVAGAWRAPEGC
jgi:asparagine synthase (glutamine-hydrolysing)